MGCDIHAYVEYSDDGKYWRSLTDNFGSRNYWVFGVLAGVRTEYEPVIKPKGMPEGDISYNARSGYWMSVAPKEKPEYAEWEKWVSYETAEKWVIQGYSIPEYKDEKIISVSDPDSHTHSWLTPDELEKCLHVYEDRHGENSPADWKAILAAMRCFESCGKITRVIFWFDN